MSERDYTKYAHVFRMNINVLNVFFLFLYINIFKVFFFHSYILMYFECIFMYIQYKLIRETMLLKKKAQFM